MTSHGIAIVGMGCRFPDADSPTDLFEHAIERRRAFRPIPPSRLSPTYANDSVDGTYLRRAAVLTGWNFPRGDYGVSRALYHAADPAHWLALQVADEALADAGFDGGTGLRRDRVGVVLGNTLTGEFSRAALLRLRAPFLGATLAGTLARRGFDPELAADVVEDFLDDVRQHFPAPDDNSLAGALSNTIAGRICNHFDFNGLGFTVDGACSSSLLSVEIATRALRDGQLDVALAGGVDLSLDPFELVGFARLGALARGDMRVYDAQPTGFVPGEGCGIVVLMRADDAARSSRRVYAVVDGVGVSSDGGGGLTRPVTDGQLLAHRRAYEMAGYEPGAVELIEGHGTGTPVGDTVELDVLRRLRVDAPGPARLGSIKANIGHTKAAAGAAGLIKAALAVHYGVKPPNTGCDRPHGTLVEARDVLDVGRSVDEFRQPVPRASVSALGFGGINCTVVISGVARRPAPARVERLRARARPRPAHDVFVVGAASRGELRAAVEQLGAAAARMSEGELADLAPHLAGAQFERFRACVAATGPWDLPEALESAGALLASWSGDLLVDRRAGVALGSGPPVRVGLLFPGQAAPVRFEPPAWAARFAETLDFSPCATDESIATEVAQPAIVFQSLLGTAWLDAMECEAQLAVGHSLGELVALAWAGALDPQATLDLAATRGRLMAEHGRARTTMAGIAAPPDVVGDAIDAGACVIAAYNAPGQTVIAGPEDDVADVVAACAANRIPARTLPVSHGFHSAAMEPVISPLAAALSSVRFERPTRCVLSTVTGAELDEDVDLREHLGRQLTHPVRFTDCMTSIGDRVDLLVEVGPGEILTSLTRDVGFDGPVTTLDVGGDPRQIAITAAALVAGAAARIDHWFAERPRRAVDPDRSRSVLANPCEVVPGRQSVAMELEMAPDVTPADPARLEPEPGEVASATIDRVLVHIGRVMDLDPETLDPTASLLADLHLTSLQVVEISEALIDALDKAPPTQPLPLATATIAELAEAIEQLGTSSENPSASVAAVGPWVRSYAHLWVEWTPTGRSAGVRWRLVAVGGHGLDVMAVHDDAGSPGDPVPGTESGVLVAVDSDATVGDIVAAIGALHENPPDRIVVASNGHGAASGIGRALSAELDDVAVTVLTTSTAVTDDDLRAATGHGYLELRRSPRGVLERPLTGLHRADKAGEIPLGEGEVCLVTGGVDGISVMCAVELARRTGATIVVTGRSAPDSQRVLDGMAALPDDIDVHYVSCDLVDEDAVRALVAAARRLGDVRGIIHGAAVNEPHRLADVTAASLDAHVGPKVHAVSNLLVETGDDLTLLAAFGSVIGRCGLVGEGAYCIANDWMRAVVERWADDHPACRTRLLEWSVWSGAGMAVRLGVVDRLERGGVVPVPPEQGVVAFVEAIADPSAPTTLTVTGRFPPSPRLWQQGLDTPLLMRFQEEMVQFAPGVELIVQPHVDLVSDGYLQDHRPGDAAVVPAVVGLEAMVQVAAGCHDDGESEPDAPNGWTIENARFTAPISIADHDGTELQIASLADGGAVDVRIRSAIDGFSTDRFEARVLPDGLPADDRPAFSERCDAAMFENGVDAAPLYGHTFFHGPRFHVVESFAHLSAYRIVARLRDDGQKTWFSEFHSQDLLLGSPALHDGIIHSLLATLPARHAVPVAIDRVTFHAPAIGEILVEATQVAADGDEYVFDVVTAGSDGRRQSTWTGLRVRAIGEKTWAPGTMPAALVGPLVSRRLDDVGWPWQVEVVTHHREVCVRADVPVAVIELSAGVDAAETGSGSHDTALTATLASAHGVDDEWAASCQAAGRRALAELGEDDAVGLDLKLVDDDVVWLEGPRVAVAVLRVHPDGMHAPFPVAVAVRP